MRKKLEGKANPPNVGIQQPTETSKNYSPKNSLNKLRDIDERGIYFEMPTIHQNDLSLKSAPNNTSSPLRTLQEKVLDMFQGWRDVRMTEEWQLYITKSDITAIRSSEAIELEECLVKTVYRLASKIQSITAGQNVSFNLPSRSSDLSGLKEQLGQGSLAEQYTKTMLLQDQVVGDKSADRSRSSKGGRSSLQDRSKQTLNVDRSGAEWAEYNTLKHQTVVLEKQVAVYSKRIKQLQECLMVFQQKLTQINGEKDHTNELMQTMILKNKYKYDSEMKTMQVEALTTELTSNRKQLQMLTYKNQQLEKEHSVLSKQNEKFVEYLKYYDLWLMASEEAWGWRMRYDECREDNLKQQGKIKALKDKNKQLLNYFNMSNMANPDQEDDKHDLDKVIKEFKEWLQVISVPKVGQDQGQSKQMAFGEVNAKLLRPNFYIFFQAFETTLQMQKNIINIRPIEYTFFIKIRTIFDTMFQAFQLANNYKQYPSFPEYVVGFLQKYQINPSTGRLQFRRKAIQNQQKITFLVNLFNKGLCNTWQCQIFKTFLFQNCYLDQVYFFLDCRNQINSGLPTNHSLGSADAISYVKLNKALRVVVKKLAPYQNYIIERVKNILKSKKKVKYGESFIDKYFVLKILLEVYGLEKAKSQRIFQTSFKARKKKQFITYENFHHFMVTNFTHLTSVEIAQLYRQAYMLSSGHPTYKTIHYVCGIRGLFIPLLLLKRRGRGHLQHSLNNDMLLLDMQNSLSKMSRHMQQLGVERFMHVEQSLNQFMRQLQYYKTNKSSFYQRLHHQKSNIIRLNTLLQLNANYLTNPTQIVEEADVQSQMIQLHTLIHHADAHLHCIGRQKQRRNKAMQMLVRNFKIRIQESMLEFQKINQNQLNKLKDKMEQDQAEAEKTPLSQEQDN